jgi:hypothetical protein
MEATTELNAVKIVEVLADHRFETSQPERLGLTSGKINRYLAVKIAALLTGVGPMAVWNALGEEPEE